MNINKIFPRTFKMPVLFFIVNTLMFAQSYPIVDTGQEKFFGDSLVIAAPSINDNYYGQDAQFNGFQPSYTDNGDGTITDNVTGLMWQKSGDFNGDGLINYSDKMSYSEAMAAADTFSLAGYNDWRMPTIKELYSLILFTGIDPSGWNGTNTDLLTPFIDDNYFEFGFGDVSSGERIIDAQYASSTMYVSTTMNNEETIFGVNFADGRIKGYPTGPMPGSSVDKQYYIKYVRGNPAYGVNYFSDNGDGTISDYATGLMWQKDDNGAALNWKAALEWVSQKNTENYLGYNDWRLPNVKELQSIVEYTRSPATTGSAAIDPVFECTEITDEGGVNNFPMYWSGTTHENMVNGLNASYVAFGEALGWMEIPPFSGNYVLMDVHGAGAQRSDPKAGDPANFPYGHGPQGDVIRIFNYVRMVRDNDTTTSVGENGENSSPSGFSLEQNYPNPFNPVTTIKYSVPNVMTGNALSLQQNVTLKVYDILGNETATLVNSQHSAGDYEVLFDAGNLSSGVYYYRLTAGKFAETKKFVLLK